MIDPERGAGQWDTLRIGNKRSPGVVRLSGHDMKVGWDIQNASATAGATTKRTNEPLREFDAEFDLTNEYDDLNISDFDLWDEFQAYLEEMVANSKKPFARDVYHPDLARNHITAVTLGSISGMTPDGKGGGKIKVHFMEFRPPKPAGKGASAATTKTAGDRETDAQVLVIKSLQDDYKDLTGTKKAVMSDAETATVKALKDEYS